MDTHAKLIKYLIVEIEIPAILGRMKLNVTFLEMDVGVYGSLTFF